MSITDLLVICSGVDRVAVVQSPDTRERQRAAAIGAIVLLTGISAFISATYAAYLAFHSRAWAGMLGLTWGAMIFTVDRLMVAGVHRPLDRGLSPLKRVQEKRHAFLITMPRLALAALTALPIAVPLQLRFFEREIDAELAHRRAEAIARTRFEVEHMYPELRTLEAQNEELRRSVIEKQMRVDKLLDAMLREESGSKNHRISADRRAVYLQARKDLEELRQSVTQQIVANDARLNTIRRTRDERATSASLNTDAGSQTLLARMDAFDSLRKRNRTIAQVSAWLLALFILLQITPVLAQLLAGSHPDAEFWEAVSVMANVSQSTASPALPALDQVSRPQQRKDVEPKPRMGDALRVFMCHCSENKPVVRALTKQLHDAHIDVWLDEERLLPGQLWENEITKAVRNADTVIICLSPRALRKRGFVQHEIRYALKVAAEQPLGSIPDPSEA